MGLSIRRRRRSHKNVCTECGRPTVRTSRMCAECENELEQRRLDAQRGFSIELAGYVPVPRIPALPQATEDGAGGSVHE